MKTKTATPATALLTLLLWRYSDLVRLGIVRNRTTLKRWQRTCGFPKPIHLGLNSHAWRASDVETWLREREQRSA